MGVHYSTTFTWGNVAPSNPGGLLARPKEITFAGALRREGVRREVEMDW